MRELTSYQDCFRKGLLQHVQPSKAKGERSIEMAHEWLRESRKNLDATAFASSISSSYMAMFHVSRAVLFRDGVREKSHYCIARYLEKYVEKDFLEEEWVFLLDRIRDVRHKDQYALLQCVTEEEAQSAYQSAQRFMERMQQLFTDSASL
ncbi:MAG: HEPN domain-containing protein [Candidatus Thermoplasmatota archaeon]|nr:HEPN domain-containing protein [Candidatus Thermoplasmatota archaeon]MBU1940763.1 HEPN domain-containing protein [Candidatus Thermoplasmatota archaeon]